MKIVRVRFDDNSENIVSSTDPHFYHATNSDAFVVGDPCFYYTERRLLSAQVVEVVDIDTTDRNQAPNSTDQKNVDGFVEFTEDDVNEIHSQNSFVRTSSHSDVEVRSSTTNISRFNQFAGSIAPMWFSTYGKITTTVPPFVQLRVENPDRRYISVFKMDIDDLVQAFEAKWRRTELPPIAEKLNMPFAVHHLHQPCLKAFKKANVREFVAAISCYLFDKNVLRAAYLPALPSVFLKLTYIKAVHPNKQDINAEAQDAFYFLVDYFSTILFHPDDVERSLWLLLARNNFNNFVSVFRTKEKFSEHSSPNAFLSRHDHVIPGHVPIFNLTTAF